MLDINQRPQLEAYLNCLNRVKVGDWIELYLKEEPKPKSYTFRSVTFAQSFYYDDSGSSSKRYSIVNYKTSIARKFQVVATVPVLRRYPPKFSISYPIIMTSPLQVMPSILLSSYADYDPKLGLPPYDTCNGLLLQESVIANAIIKNK